MLTRNLLCLSMTAVLSNMPLASAMEKVGDEAALISAIQAANSNPGITSIKFAPNARVSLSAPVIYTGSQPLSLIGNGAVIDGSAAGSFDIAEDLTAVTEDGTLVFNTAAALNIRDLSVVNSATRGIVVNVPADAEGESISVSLHQVVISDSALYGLHIDDNADAFEPVPTGGDEGFQTGDDFAF